MGVVAALAAAEIHLWILDLDTTTDRQRLLVFRPEAFVARPGFDQCAVDRKMLRSSGIRVGEQAGYPAQPSTFTGPESGLRLGAASVPEIGRASCRGQAELSRSA